MNHQKLIHCENLSFNLLQREEPDYWPPVKSTPEGLIMDCSSTTNT